MIRQSWYKTFFPSTYKNLQVVFSTHWTECHLSGCESAKLPSQVFYHTSMYRMNSPNKWFSRVKTRTSLRSLKLCDIKPEKPIQKRCASRQRRLIFCRRSSKLKSIFCPRHLLAIAILGTCLSPWQHSWFQAKPKELKALVEEFGISLKFSVAFGYIWMHFEEPVFVNF